MRIFLFIICICLQASLAGAVTLNEAIKEVIASNPNIKSSWHSVESSDYGKKQAFGAFLPEITARGSSSNQHYNLTDGSTRSDQPLEYTFEVRQPIFNGGKIHAGYKEAGYRQEEAKQAHDLLKQDTILQLVDAYADSLYYEDINQSHKEQTDILKQQWDLTRKSFDKKTVLASDVARAESRYIEAMAEYLNVQGQYKQAKAKLTKIYGNNIDTVIWPEENHNLPQEEAEITKAILDNNPAILRASKATEVQKQLIRKSQANYYPEVSAIASHTGGDDRVNSMGMLKKYGNDIDDTKIN